MARLSALRRGLAVFLFFSFLTFIVLSPLSYHPGSLIPMYRGGGGWDYFHFHWNLWWVREAVFHGQDPYYTNKVLAPFTHNLSYHSLTASIAPLYMILEPLLGHLRAANTIMGLLMVFSGAVMFLFLRRQGVLPATALLGGTALAFCPYMLDHVSSAHLNLLTAFWVPAGLLVWQQTAATRRVRWAVLTGIVLWGAWTSDTLIVLWTGLLLGPYALLTLVQARERHARRRLVLLGALALAILLALAWIIGPLRQTLAFDTSQLEGARLITLHYYSVPLKAYVWPHLARGQNRGYEGDDTLGLALIVLAWAGLPVRSGNRQRWFWLAAAVIPFVLTLGPDTKILGVTIPLPFRIIHSLFHGQMRTPDRFLIPGTVALLTYLALTYDPLLRRVRRPGRRLLIVGGMLLVFAVDFGIFIPYFTTQALPEYELYRMMGREHYADYDYVVLEVPAGPQTGWRLTGSHPEAMYYGITHHKRMVSGLLSRIPLNEHLFYDHSYLISYLARIAPLNADRASSELNRFVDEWPIGYVVVHEDWLSLPDAPQILGFLNAQTSLCYLETEKDVVLYRTTSHPKGCPPRTPPETAPGVFTVDFGQGGDEGFIGHGWHWQENIGGVQARWAGAEGPEALIYADLPTGSSYTVTLRATAFVEPREVKVTAGDLVDGVPQGTRLGYFTAQPDGWGSYSITLPADLLERVQGHLVLALSADKLLSPVDLGLSADPRTLSLAYDWIRFEPVVP